MATPLLMREFNMSVNITTEYKIHCNEESEITISSHGTLTLHRMTNYHEWVEDIENNYPATVKPLREEVGSAYMCHHQLEQLIEALKLTSAKVKAREAKWKKEAQEREKAKTANKKAVKKTTKKAVKKK